MENLTKQEAIQAMKDGEIVTHNLFNENSKPTE